MAAAVDYRLIDHTEATRWPAQLADTQLAVQWLRLHARELNVDPSHICALGGSAGGTLSLFLGILDKLVIGVTEVSPKVTCVVIESAPVDLTFGFVPPAAGLFGPITGEALANAARDASPLFRVSPATSPVLVVHGTRDPLVPFDQAQRLVHTLQQNGVPAQLISHDGGHGFKDVRTSEWQAIQRAEIEFIRKGGP